VPAQFDGQLVNRRKLFPPDLRGVLARSFSVRQTADCSDISLTATEAGRTLRRARQFVKAVHAREEAAT
jgi:hypothetical protein